MIVKKPSSADFERTLARFESHLKIGTIVENVFYLVAVLGVLLRIVVPYSIWTFWLVVGVLAASILAMFSANYVGGLEKKITNLKHTGLVWSTGWCCLRNDEVLRLGYHHLPLMRACGSIVGSVFAPFLLLDFKLLEQGINAPWTILAGAVFVFIGAVLFKGFRRGSHLVVDSKFAVRSRFGRQVLTAELPNVTREEVRHWAGQHVVVLKDAHSDAVLYLGPPQVVEEVHNILSARLDA